jgi:hypothetical protein
MTPIDKIQLAIAELLDRRVRKATAAPLPYRLLWRLGIAIPPPLFQSFVGLAVFHGLLFGVPLGAILACADRRLAPDGATILGTISGAIFGLVMAIHFRLEARRLGLPSWEAFPYEPGTEEEEGW